MWINLWHELIVILRTQNNIERNIWVNVKKTVLYSFKAIWFCGISSKIKTPLSKTTQLSILRQNI